MGLYIWTHFFVVIVVFLTDIHTHIHTYIQMQSESATELDASR